MQAGTTVSETIRRGPYGVGGWLRFFCVYTGVIQPVLYMVGQSNDAGGDGRKLLTDLFCLFSIIVVINLWFVIPKAIGMLRAFFALVIGLEVSFIVYHLAMRDIGDPKVFFAQRFQSLLYVMIWVAYFHRSERVKNTYGVNL